MDDEVMRQTFPLFVNTTATTTWFSALASSSRSFFVNHLTLLMLYLGTDVVCLKETKSLQVSTR